MRIKVKVRDAVPTLSVIIDRLEAEYPQLDKYEIENNRYGDWIIFDLEKGERVKVAAEAMDLLQAINKIIESENYLATIVSKGILTFKPKPTPQPEPTPAPQPVRREPQPRGDWGRPREGRPDGDTEYEYGEQTANKLREFIERFGHLLANGDAELKYSRTRGIWLPRFGYNQDNPPSDEEKAEVRDYVTQRF